MQATTPELLESTIATAVNRIADGIPGQHFVEGLVRYADALVREGATDLLAAAAILI